MKLLLIDSRVGNQSFTNARNVDVDFIIFDYMNDTYSHIIQQISAKGNFTDIALVQHADMFSGINILLSEQKCDTNEDAPYASFDSLKQFLISLKVSAGLERFDFLGCALYDPVKMKPIFDYLEASTNVDLRASTNFTGNAPDGDWILESDNVDVKNTYFTEAISEFKGVLIASSGAGAYYINNVTYDVSRNIIYRHTDICGRPIGPLYDASGFNLKFPESRNITQGGDWTYVDTLSTQTNVVCIVDGHQGLYGLQSDGKIANLGLDNTTGFPTGATNSGFVGLYSSAYAYTGLRSDGSVFTWGHSAYSGTPPTISGFIQIVTSDQGFCALHHNGTISIWGLNPPTFPAAPAGSYYTAIYANNTTYAALTNLGRIMCAFHNNYADNGGRAPNTNTGYKSITPSYDGYAALHSNGSIVVWGHPSSNPALGHPTTSDFIEIKAGDNHYGARKANGTIVYWGAAYNGSTISGYTTYSMRGNPVGAAPISYAIHKNGYMSLISSSITHTTETDFVSVFTSVRSAVAIRSDGRLKAYGYADQNWAAITGVPTDGGYVYIQFMNGLISALKNDGTVTIFGPGGQAHHKIAPSGGNFIYISTGGTAYNNRFSFLKTTNTSAVSDYYYSTGASKIITPPPPPPSGGDAVTAAIASATVNQATITDFITATTKTSLQIYGELKAAINTSNLYNTTKYNDTIKATIAGLRTKTGASTIDVSYNDIYTTFKSKISNAPIATTVTILLPDFSVQNPSVTIPADKEYIKIEAPTDVSFSITVGSVVRNFTLNLSGVDYIKDNTTNTNYYLGDEIVFGAVIKKLVGFGSILFQDVTQAADAARNAVRIYLPMTFELSGMDIDLFGQKYEMSGTLIKITEPLTVSGFYDPSNNKSWIQYKQDVSENNFTASVKDTSSATAIKNSILGAVHLTDGSVYNSANRGVNKLDCSAVFAGVDTNWQRYQNLQDFIMSYFAEKVLGHPGALAAISNDSNVRNSVTTKFPVVLNELSTMSEDKLKLIIQQMMNQDLSRFDSGDKGTYQPLIFRTGDKLLLQLLLKDNTFSLQTPTYAPSTVQDGIITAESQSATSSSTSITAVDYYLLEFTLA